MRNTTKLIPVLLLGSVLSGCSLAGSGDFFADKHAKAQAWGQTGQYGQTGCAAPTVAVQPQAVPQQVIQQQVVQPQLIQPNCGQVGFAQQGFTQQNFAQPNFVQPNFVQPTVTQAPAVQPGFVQPGFAQPGFAQPAFVQPGFTQPGFAQPTFAQPSFGQGAFVPPTFGVNQFGLRGQKPVSDSYLYGTVGGVNYDVGEDIYGIQGRVGYQFNRFFGAEAEGSFGVVDDTDQLIDATGTVIDQEINVDYSVAGFGVLRYPLIGKLSGLSRIGYHTSNLAVTESDAAGLIGDVDFNTDGIAYGTGVEYAFDPQTALRLDYTIYDYDGPDADALSLAVSRKF